MSEGGEAFRARIRPRRGCSMSAGQASASASNNEKPKANRGRDPAVRVGALRLRQHRLRARHRTALRVVAPCRIPAERLAAHVQDAYRIVMEERCIPYR